jgi:hypothetical protein
VAERKHSGGWYPAIDVNTVFDVIRPFAFSELRAS